MISGYFDSTFPAVSICNGAVKVTIPEWINEMLFERFGAIHRPAGIAKTFDRNLNSDAVQVQTYLGTYFPRSLAESFVIFDSLLSDKSLAASLAREGRVSVCSVGTGTGGDLLGLLLAINKQVPTVRQIDIVSIEGNAIAHDQMYQILAVSQQRLSSKLYLQLINHVFEPPLPFSCVNEMLPRLHYAFDFVISSKMLNELDGLRISKSPYYEFCSSFSRLLKPMGVLMVLDVTSRNGAEGSWTPKVLNGQVNEFTAEHKEFKTILPLLCNRFEGECGGSCYTQNLIHVNYRNVTNECSKICYRVIGSSVLASKLSSSVALWKCPITENNKANCHVLKGTY